MELAGLGDMVTLRSASASDTARLRDWVGDRRGEVLGIDVEATGLDHWAPSYSVRTVQMSDADEAWIVEPGVIDRDELSRMIRGHRLWVAHNAKYDTRALRRCLPAALSTDPANAHVADLMVVLAHYEPRTVVATKDGIDPRLRLPGGLKETSERELTPTLVEAEVRMLDWFKEIRPKGVNGINNIKAWGFANAPTDHEVFLTYAGLDPLLTVRLWHRFRQKLVAAERWELVRDDIWLQWAVDLATDSGMLLDEDYVRWLAAQLEAAKEGSRETLDRHGISSADAHTQIRTVLTDLGAETSKTTGSGAPSFDRTVLAELAGQPGEVGELVTAIQAARRAGKFHASYLRPMLRALEQDGHIHPEYRVNGTSTGRMSAKEPPVQQFPKKDTRVRAACRAPEGFVLISSDFSQIEPRTMAALSGDTALRDAVLAGDLNSDIAALSYGEKFDRAQIEDVTTEHYVMRQKAKAAFLAWCYGAQPKRVADTLGLPEEHGQTVVSQWKKAYPKLAELIRDLGAQRVVTLVTGRRCPLWDRYFVTEDGKARTRNKSSRLALNYASQGTAREILAIALRRLRRSGWIKYLWALIHDEVILCVPADQADAALLALKEAMTMTFLGIPIEAKPEVLGTHWGARPASFAIDMLDALDDVA